MTMTEKQIIKATNDFKKAQSGIERTTKQLEKVEAKCSKLDCLWSEDEYFKNHRETATDEQYAAYFDLLIKRDHMKDYQHKLEVATRQLDKLSGKILNEEAEKKLSDHIDSIQNTYETRSHDAKEDYEKWLAQFKAECKKDGIEIESASYNYISGLSASGKEFHLYINNGSTERSWHSYTLTVNGDTIFTSGLFCTAYRYLMR